jgi:hypothetical protein
MQREAAASSSHRPAPLSANVATEVRNAMYLIYQHFEIFLLAVAVVMLFMLPVRIFLLVFGGIVGMGGLLMISIHPFAGMIMLLFSPAIIVWGIILVVRAERQEAADAEETARMIRRKMRGRVDRDPR